VKKWGKGKNAGWKWTILYTTNGENLEKLANQYTANGQKV